MIKAKYIGRDIPENSLFYGKNYEIKTFCRGNCLEVSYGDRFRKKVKFNSLESFLKNWKIVGVYHG